VLAVIQGTSFSWSHFSFAILARLPFIVLVFIELSNDKQNISIKFVGGIRYCL
jgi:hypothetical protein